MTREEIFQNFTLGAAIKVATMQGIIKLIREVGQDFSHHAVTAVLEKMYPGITKFDLDEVITIGEKIRAGLGVSPMTHSPADIIEVRTELAAVYQKSFDKPLSKRLKRLTDPEVADGWVSIGGVQYAVTPKGMSVDFEGDTLNNL